MKRVIVNIPKNSIKELKNKAEELYAPTINSLEAKYGLDIPESRRKMMRLKKSDLIDIIISAFIIEQNEAVKTNIALMMRMKINSLLDNDNNGKIRSE